MSEEAAKLLALALALPDAEREELGQTLIDSVESDDDLPDDPAWRAELDRRLDEVEKHPEQLLDGPAVMAELRARYERLP